MPSPETPQGTTYRGWFQQKYGVAKGIVRIDL